MVKDYFVQSSGLMGHPGFSFAKSGNPTLYSILKVIKCIALLA